VLITLSGLVIAYLLVIGQAEGGQAPEIYQNIHNYQGGPEGDVIPGGTGFRIRTGLKRIADIPGQDED